MLRAVQQRRPKSTTRTDHREGVVLPSVASRRSKDRRERLESFFRRAAGSSREPSSEELARLEKTELTVCMECAGNGGVGMHGLVGNAVWGGVRLSTILEELAVRPEAREVVFWGADGAEERLRGNRYPSRFARSLPVADALDENVLLAYEMNGEPLAPEHGFPLRLIVPGWYGIAHVKWLTRVEVIDYRFMGWFMAKDYVTVRGERRGESIVHRATSVGRARLKSIITRVARPVAGARDSLAIHGFAWSDGTGVAAVEVRIDDGPFVSAELEPPETRFAWTPFHVRWRDATKGRHRLVSRAGVVARPGANR